MVMNRAQIRKLREALNLTRNEFARFLGVSEMSVVRWENGSDPKALHRVFLAMMLRALEKAGVDATRDAVLSCAVDHCIAVRDLANLAYPESRG